MIKLLKWLWQKIFGRKLKAIRIGNKQIWAPLFIPLETNRTKLTWCYIAFSDRDRKLIRQNILATCPRGMIPAIAFLLTPSWEVGELWHGTTPTGKWIDLFPTINEQKAAVLVKMVQELIDDGIAAFPVLYTDDGDTNPKHPDIVQPAHQSAWRDIHRRIGHLVTGYLLSIESTERTQVSQTQHCIHIMRQCLPGIEHYGTHQQWRTQWSKPSETPANATIIFGETSWHPNNGDSAGLVKLKTDTAAMLAATGPNRLIVHEYNANPRGHITAASREWLATQPTLKGFG